MYKFFAITIVLSLMGVSCTMNYSFTGTSLSPDAKTVSVGYFRNQSALVNPRLSDQFTEAIKDRLLSDTRLRLTTGEGDLMFEGEITNYDQTYDAVQANETAGLNRLTITVRVRYTNNLEPAKNFERSFSKFATYSAGQNITQVEDQLVKQINEDLLNDIFSATVADW